MISNSITSRKSAASKRRLDLAMVERGLAPTRERAQALILAGAVRVNDRPARRAAEPIQPDDVILVEASTPYVSRGGYKLAHALDTFHVDPAGLVALDAGASTGGFTDVLLQRGARRVYAVDVGYGQLDYRLRQDPRVVVMDRTNLRTLRALPEPIDLATLDLSFISLCLVLPAVERLLGPTGRVIMLIKPQFEVGKGRVGKGGVVRAPELWAEAVARVFECVKAVGLELSQLTTSPLRGPAGNREFLLLAGRTEPPLDEAAAIATVMADA
jgi:23S rRNA (cytidine1920-2'-O)/16S rRNA (cytidine1409-2'-O)-methyltransferase